MNTKLKSKIMECYRLQYIFAKEVGIRDDRLSAFIYERSIPTEDELSRMLKKLKCKNAKDLGFKETTKDVEGANE